MVPIDITLRSSHIISPFGTFSREKIFKVRLGHIHKYTGLLQVKKTISSNTSVYTSECIALDLILDIALSTSNKNVHISTDSLSVLEALKSIKISAKTNPFILNIKKVQ